MFSFSAVIYLDNKVTESWKSNSATFSVLL